MEVYETVRTVLAVREYQDKLVPQEVIRKVVESAWLTASSMNKQPWHFIVVEEREILQRMGAQAAYGRYIAQASFAVVVAIEESIFSVSDASRAIQSMVLTAWSEGVGSNWVGFRGLDWVRPMLGIPDNLDVLAIVPFGYPVKKIGKGKKNRKPFSQVVSLGRFGNSF